MAPVMKKLERQELEHVHDFLHEMGMPVNRLLHREYADGVLIAKLLKKLYPRYVDMHLYESKYSRDLKVRNWQTLNTKVFRRIGFTLEQNQIDMLAKAESGTVERLIWVIMKHIENDKKSLQQRKSSLISASNSSRSILEGSKYSRSMSRPFGLIENTINEVYDKMSTLESLLKERDNGIKDLLRRVHETEAENVKLKRIMGIKRTPYN